MVRDSSNCEWRGAVVAKASPFQGTMAIDSSVLIWLLGCTLVVPAGELETDWP